MMSKSSSEGSLNFSSLPEVVWGTGSEVVLLDPLGVEVLGSIVPSMVSSFSDVLEGFSLESFLDESPKTTKIFCEKF